MKSVPIEQIIAYLENRHSVEEKEKLENWISESAENEKQFNEIKMLFANSEKLKIAFEPSPEKALQKVNQALNRKRFIRWTQSAAAAILLIFVITKVVFLILPKTEWIEITAQQQQEIFLPDSSLVVLAQNAQIKYPEEFNKTERTVLLNGKAYFEIQRNKEQPFVVNTSNTKITVLGTKFLVNASVATTEQVIVDEGKVSFSQIHQGQNNVIYLTENEIGTWNAYNNKISESKVTGKNVNSWLSGILTFNDNTLSEVINDFKRVYNINIELVEKDYETKKYTGNFKNTKPEIALETVAITLNLSIEKRGNTYIFRK